MSPAECLGIEIRQYVGDGNLKTLVPRVIGQTEQALSQKSGTRTFVDADWDHYRRNLPEQNHAVAHELYDRLRGAIAERGLPWAPALRRPYFGFKRPGDYYTTGVALRSEKPVQLWIKLPARLSELRDLGQDVEDPYPQLVSFWNAGDKQQTWEVPTIGDVPDLGPVIDLARRYQPESGPMLPPSEY